MYPFDSFLCLYVFLDMDFFGGDENAWGLKSVMVNLNQLDAIQSHLGERWTSGTPLGKSLD